MECVNAMKKGTYDPAREHLCREANFHCLDIMQFINQPVQLTKNLLFLSWYYRFGEKCQCASPESVNLPCP